MKLWHVVASVVALSAVEVALRSWGVSHHITGACDFYAGMIAGVWIFRK